jgi:hypothetical protein
VQGELKPYVAGNLHLWTKLYAMFIINVVFEDFGWKQQQYLRVFVTKTFQWLRTVPFCSCVLSCLSSSLIWLKASYCVEGGHYLCMSVKRMIVLVMECEACIVLVFRYEHTNERKIGYDDLRVMRTVRQMLLQWLNNEKLEMSIKLWFVLKEWRARGNKA